MTGPVNILGLQKGLRLLEFLNTRNGAALGDVVRQTGLPKSTAYRFLENLRRCGYLDRDSGDGRYFLTIRVRRLSDGFDDGAWIEEIAEPAIRRLARRVVYPVTLSTPFGTSMVTRMTTESETSLLPDQYPRGTLLPLFNSAAGKVYLAFSPAEIRTALLDICGKSDDPDHRFARHPRLVEQVLREVRQQGYAFSLRSRRTLAAGQTSTMAVPINSDNRVIGCLSLRYLDVAMNQAQVISRFLEGFQRCARRIGQRVDAAAGQSRL